MDQVVPVQQSIEFAAKLKPVLGEDRVVLEVIEVAEHGDAKFESPENITGVLDSLDSHSK